MVILKFDILFDLVTKLFDLWPTKSTADVRYQASYVGQV